jgi:hypothetical protein
MSGKDSESRARLPVRWRELPLEVTLATDVASSVDFQIRELAVDLLM